MAAGIGEMPWELALGEHAARANTEATNRERNRWWGAVTDRW